jgi:hypothetical protein
VQKTIAGASPVFELKMSFVFEKFTTFVVRGFN